MNLPASSEESINQYLEAVKRNLNALPEDQQREILDDLRSQIYSRLENRGPGLPTQEEVETVLEEMDSPDSFPTASVRLSSPEPVERHISRRAIIGLIIIILGLLSAWIATSLNARINPTLAAAWQINLQYILLFVGILAPFVSTALGVWSILEIRTSGGRTSGMPLAFFVSLFYPILVGDLILFYIGAYIFRDFEEYSVIPLIWLVLVLGLDYFIIRTIWRRVRS